MSRITTTFATAGAAMLLVVASFAAGSATSSPSQSSMTGTDLTIVRPAADPQPPNPDALREDDGTQAVPTAANPAELSYVPIGSCRIVDTRATSKFGNGTGRPYYAAGSTGISEQGGKSGGCGIPASATAITAIVLAYTPSAAGRFKLWAAGAAEPSANTMWYPKASTSGEITIGLTPGVGRDFKARNYSSSTHLIIDVTGYYVPPLSAYIANTGDVIDSSGRVVSATRASAGVYQLTWDRNIDSCAATASSDYASQIVGVYTSGAVSTVYVWNNAGAATDYWVNVVITC